MRVPAQARLVVRPACQQHQHPCTSDPVEGLAEELEGGGIDPVRVLDHHQHGSAACKPEKLLDQHGQRAGALLVRREVPRCVASSRIYSEQRCSQRRRLADVLYSLVQQRLKFVELRRDAVSRRKAGSKAELLGYRPERRAGVMRRALAAQRDVFAPGDRVEGGLDQARLADAGLADQE